MRERELKLPLFFVPRLGLTSLPMRERELKPTGVPNIAVSALSLPMRERELKLTEGATRSPPEGRSPCGSVN